MTVSMAGQRDAWAQGPGRLVTIASVVLLSLLVSILVSGWVGAAVLALGLLLIVRPFDAFLATLLVASVAAFAGYGTPSIQRDLAIVLMLTVYAAASLMCSLVCNRWALPLSSHTRALLALAVTTAVAVIHGLVTRNPIPYISLEVFPLFSLAFSLGIGGLRLTSGDLRIAQWTLAAVGMAASSIGFYSYATTGLRTGGLGFSPIPGFVALVILSLALFDPAPRARLFPVFLFCVLLCHQIVTFTRGFWLGLLIGIPLVCVIYARRGPGARRRWSKVMGTLGLAAGILLLCAMIASTQHPWSDIIGLMGNRFTSSFETKSTPETVSNVVRLVELRTSLQAILASPWLGHGHGATLVVRQFFHPIAGPQWWVHQSYVMIWLKQGIFGLGALLWVLAATFMLGLRGASHRDPRLAGWCAASAACTVFAAILGLTNYFFFVVSQSFLLALLWGISLSASEPKSLLIVWRTRQRVAAQDGPGGAGSAG